MEEVRSLRETRPRSGRGFARSRSFGGLLAVAGLALTALLGACANDSGSLQDAFTGFGSTDLTARKNDVGGKYGTRSGNQDTRGRVYGGEGRPERTGSVDGSGGVPEGSITQEGDGFLLNFENVEVAALAKSILGDILGENYTVDSRATGTVSLNSARAVPRGRLVSVMETALKAVNIAVAREGAVYRITPSSEAIGSGRFDYAAAGEGYGTSVIPAKFVSAQTLARVLESFASKPGALKVDAATNLVLIQGTAAERRAALDAATLVDTDWMRDQSVGIFPLANSSPETVIGELNRILDAGEGGVGQGQVQLQPMSRLNAILVVSKRRDAVDIVQRWVKRLDRVDQAAAGVKVYRLKYGQAKNVAALLNDAFSGRGSGQGGSGADKDSLEPVGGGRGGTLTQSSGSAGSGGASGGNAVGGSRVGSAFAAFPNSSGNASSGGAATGMGTAGGGSELGAGNGAAGGSGGGGGSHGSGGPGSTVRVTADIPNNTLLIYASAADYKLVERTIRELDRPPVQVAIEATIAEVKLTDQLNYGVQFYLKSSDLGAGGNRGSVGVADTAKLARTLPGFNLLLGPKSEPRMVLDALQTLTNVKILSSPSLVVLDNQPAVLQVGDQVPITTRTANSVDNPAAPIVNNVEFRDTGIILRVMPRVNANGVVTLDVEQEISNVVNKDSQSLTPTIAQRRVRSQIAVSSGQTVLLAGLITERRESNREGLPGLVSVKFLNEILASNTKTAERTELIIFIKPQIIRDQADAQSVAEEFRDRFSAMRQPLR
ncbi:type II secretion system protein GspD [Prosthecomicrobium hirschii]|nr:type II secretion system protein GspD [Prosthecomicrobium hirschii]